MATHCSVLGWRIPWTEEPGGLKSIGSVGLNKTGATEHTQGTLISASGEFRAPGEELKIPMNQERN